MQTGTVVSYHREFCHVRLDGTSTEVVAKPRSRLEIEQLREEKDYEKEGRPRFTQQIAVGDRVAVDEPVAGRHVIEAIHERETWLMRRGTKRYRRKPQLVVANADQLAVVVSAAGALNLNVVDRYFLAAIQGGLEPLLVVNKIDLAPELEQAIEFTEYRNLGYSVHYVSALDGYGIDRLVTALADKLTVFCGHSGVGKSTILRRVTGLDINIGEINPKTGKGRQTTVTTRMYCLDSGIQLVDTPGIRVFGLAHLTWLDVHEYFSKIAELAVSCEYRNCLHDSEPGCRVKQAIADGQLSQARLESYIKLRGETDEKHWLPDRE